MMGSSISTINKHNEFAQHTFPQFCQACLAFDDEISRIERLLDKPEPWARGDREKGPKEQLMTLPSLEINRTRHIWDHSTVCRCCQSLRDYVLKKLPSIVAADYGRDSLIDLNALSVSAVLLPYFPELAVPRLLLKAGVDIITKDTESYHKPDVDEFYSTTSSSKDGLLVRAVGPRIDFSLMRQWVNECRLSHGTKCSQYQLPSDWNLIDALPQDMGFYLIDVHCMCLHVTSLDSAPRYVALSYRWGDPELSTQCRQSNLAMMKTPGGLMSKDVVLAPTIRDAITVTRELGFRYIWVDALCIVQDDYDHKPAHLNLMGTVYADAALVLAILEGNADMGIMGVGRDRDLTETITLPSRSLIKSTRRLTETDVFSDKTWATRGWTFQEGLFASKLLTIDNFASWHCPRANWLEEVSRHPEARHESNHQVANTQDGPKQLTSTPFLDLPRVPTYMSLTAYAQLVQSYNARSLSMDTDALNAIAGLTGRLHSHFPDGFLQGLPQFFIDVALLWQPRSPLRPRVSTSSSPTLPSWSWAAWHGDLDLSAWSDSHMIYDGPLPVRNNRIVNWQKYRYMKRPNGEMQEEWRDIQFTFHMPRGKFEDPSVTEMPWAWTAHSIEDANGDASGRYFTYDPKDRENHMQNIKFRFPIPPFERLRNFDRNTTHAPLLKGKVKIATFTLNTQSLSDTTSERVRAVEDALLVDESGERVGWLRLTLYDEQRPSDGIECELVAISEGVLKTPHHLSDSNTQPQIPALVESTRGGESHFYHVLWIKWKGDVAYRRALGQVAKGAWEQRPVKETEILLG